MENEDELVDAALMLPSPAGIRRVPIGRRPLRIGSRRECDLVVAQPDAEHDREVAIWQHQGQITLRSRPGKVDVNGHAWSWAVLDDGDRIRLGDLMLTLEISPSKDKQAEPPRVLNERRTSFRLPVQAPGRLLDHPSHPDHPSHLDAHAVEVLVTDIGDGGAKVLTSLRVTPGERITVKVAVPPDGAAARLELVVRSVQSADDGRYPFAAHCMLDKSGDS